ncbi:MAG: ABC transporter permease, partial [Chitinophagaceae bacterium]
MPLSIVLSNLVKFGVQIILLLLIFLYYIIFKDYHPETNVYLLFFPVAILMMALLGLSSGLIISAMTTKYRDLSFLVTFGVQLMMYATPVIYPLSAVPERYKWIVAINPMTGIFEAMRYGLLGRGTFDVTILTYSAITTIVLLITGVLVFNKVEKNFVDTV